jgi:S1-C subfamily serine protease
MNAFDILVLVLLGLGLLAGARAGFLGPVLGLLGGIGGFALALVLVSALREPLLTIEQPTRALVTIIGLAGLVIFGEALGAGIGASMSRGIRFSPLRPLDMAGGALFGAAHVVLLVWLVGGLATMGVTPLLGPTARESVAIRVTSEQLPPPGVVAGRVMELLAATELPSLFGGLEPLPSEPVDLPADATVRALAESAIASTARVASTGCGAGLSVGSAFFIGPEHAVTNAHVVAGGESMTVALAGAEMAAVVVAFDSSTDLALLHVPGAGAPAIELAAASPARGTAAAVLGYPGGGELTVTSAAVTATFNIPGPDIYGSGSHPHSVVEVRGEIRRGNSGGPLVVAPGVAGAVVFGASRTSAEVGYAIGAEQARQSIGPFIGATAPVDTGPCL